MNSFIFPYLIRKINIKPYSLPKEKLDFNDLTFVLKGHLNYVVNGKSVTVNAGDGMFIKAGNYRIRHKSNDISSYICFNFTTEEEIDLPLLMKNCINSELRLLLMFYDEALKKLSPRKNEKISVLLKNILLTLYDYIDSKKNQSLSEQIATYIHLNYTEKLTLKNISEEFFYTPQYCEKIFKKDYGVSIIKYLLNLRIEEAKALLLANTMPPSQIPFLIGFNDYNYFCRIFKKQTGLTPSEYKKLFFSKKTKDSPQ